MNIIEELNNKNKKLLTLVGQEAVIVNDIYNQIHLQRKLQEVEIKKFKLEKNTDYTHIKSDTHRHKDKGTRQGQRQRT